MSVSCECWVLSATGGRSLVQRSPTKCRVSECDREASVMRSPWPSSGCCAMKIVSMISQEYKISFGRNWFFSSVG